MAEEASVPAPVYVRYLGPGDAYHARFTVGPYRTLTEIRRGVPAPLPADAAQALIETGEFEQVDVAEAIGEIAEAEAERAAEEAAWKAHLIDVQRRKAAEAPLHEIHAARLEVMREAVIETHQAAATAGGPVDEGDAVALAVARATEFEEVLKALDRG